MGEGRKESQSVTYYLNGFLFKETKLKEQTICFVNKTDDLYVFSHITTAIADPSQTELRVPIFLVLFQDSFGKVKYTFFVDLMLLLLLMLFLLYLIFICVLLFYYTNYLVKYTIKQFDGFWSFNFSKKNFLNLFFGQKTRRIFFPIKLQ